MASLFSEFSASVTFLLATRQEITVEIPKRIELRVGETYRLELPGLGTSGYRWVHEILENPNLIEISVTTARPSPSSTEGNLPSVGSNLNEIFTLTAQSAGNVVIRFTQRRPWMQNHPPLQEHLLDVHIHN